MNERSKIELSIDKAVFIDNNKIKTSNFNKFSQKYREILKPVIIVITFL